MSAPGIFSGGRTKSTRPVEIALRGIASCSAVVGSCTMTMPPPDLISLIPGVPEEPVPESTIPIAFSCWSSASDRRKMSSALGEERISAAASRSTPPPIVITRSGGITYTRSATTRSPSEAATTGSLVCRRRISGIRLSRLGSRCGIATKPMPHFSGSASSSLTKAFRPPAEATMPTIGRISGPSSFAAGTRGAGLWVLGFSAAGALISAGLPRAFAAPLAFLDLRGMCATPNGGNSMRCYGESRPETRRVSAAIAVDSFRDGKRAEEPSRRQIVGGHFIEQFEHLELIALQRYLEEDRRLDRRAARNGAGDLPHVDRRVAAELEALARPRLDALDRFETSGSFSGRAEHRMSLSDACENAFMAHSN